MSKTLVSAPASYPVSVDDAKDFLNVDYTDKDALIEAFIVAAVDHFQNALAIAFIDQTWDFFWDQFPRCGTLDLLLSPVIEVLGVFYTDTTGAEQEIASGNYVADLGSSPARISMPQNIAWPCAGHQLNAVRVRARVGHLGDDSPPTENVPEIFKTAIKLWVAGLFDPGLESVNQKTFHAAADSMVRNLNANRGFA